MSKQIKIEDKEVILKRVKWKERKELIDQFGDKIQSIANMIFPEKGELTSERNLFNTACDCVMKNTDDIGVLMVWLGDKLANMRSIYREFKVEGNDMWQNFNQKDPAEQAWYYHSIVKLTERISDTSAWIEYKTLTELVFGKGM